jgi:hypothetical protein
MEYGSSTEDDGVADRISGRSSSSAPLGSTRRTGLVGGGSGDAAARPSRATGTGAAVGGVGV